MKAKELETMAVVNGEVKVGDRVVFVADIYDPHITTGTITKLYNSDPDGKAAPQGKLWILKASIKRSSTGAIVTNVQARRIYKLADAPKDGHYYQLVREDKYGTGISAIAFNAVDLEEAVRYVHSMALDVVRRSFEHDCISDEDWRCNGISFGDGKDMESTVLQGIDLEQIGDTLNSRIYFSISETEKPYPDAEWAEISGEDNELLEIACSLDLSDSAEDLKKVFEMMAGGMALSDIKKEAGKMSA